jgi:hypothetical protein
VLDESDLFAAGYALATFILDWSWVIRRVEHISFYDDVAYKRTVRVDFDASRLPVLDFGAAKHKLAPLTLLSKQTITNLDYHHGNGAAAGTLTAREESVVAAAMLVKTAYGVLKKEHPQVQLSSEQIQRLRELTEPAAAADPDGSLGPMARPVDKALFLGHDDPVLALLVEYPPFLLLARALAASLPAIVILDAGANSRDTVTFSHDTMVRRTRAVDSHETSISRVRVPLFEAAARSMGWSPHKYWFVAPSVGRGGTFHLVLEVPLGLKVTVQSLLPFTRDRSRRLQRLGTSSVTGTMHKARLYATQVPAGAVGVATVGIRARLSTTILPSTIMGAGSVTVLVGGVIALARSRSGDLDVGAAAILVPLVPTLAAGYVARGAEEHQLTSKIVWGVRVLAIVVGVCNFVAAASLGISKHRATNLVTWAICLGVATAATIALCAGALHTHYVSEARSRRMVSGAFAHNRDGSAADRDPGRPSARFHAFRWLCWAPDTAPVADFLRSKFRR